MSPEVSPIERMRATREGGGGGHSIYRHTGVVVFRFSFGVGTPLFVVLQGSRSHFGAYRS